MSGKPSSPQAPRCDCSNKQKVPQTEHSKDSDDLCVMSKNLWTLLNEQRDQPELCDVTLTVGDRHLHAHKVVLVANIPYFKAMFKYVMKETNSIQIEIKEFGFECLEMVINYVYGQEITITPESFLDLAAADFYQLPNLKKKCLIAFPEVFTKDFDVGQLLPLYSFCQLIKETKHIGPIEDAIKDNFEAVSMHPDFPKLPFETISKFCSADALTVKGEEVILQAICRWLRENPDWKRYAEELLACVRLPLLEISTLSSLTYSKELKYYEGIKTLANHAIEVKENKKYSTNFQDGAREPIGTTIIFPPIVKSQGKNDFTLYSISDVLWTESEFVPKHNFTKFVSISGEQLCWYESEKHQFAYRSFTCSLLKVHEKTINYSPAHFDSRTPRNYEYEVEENHPKAISNGKSWIFGNFHNSILTLWKDNSRVCTRIEGIKRGAVLVYLNEAVYIIGGVSKGREINWLRDVLMVKEGEISVKKEVQPFPVAPMVYARDSPSAVAFKGKIYVCGGMSYDGYQASCEVYDPQKDEWKLFAYPKTWGNDVATLYATKSNLYAQTKLFERFDEIEEKWKKINFRHRTPNSITKC